MPPASYASKLEVCPPCAPPIKSEETSTTHSLTEALNKQKHALTGKSRSRSSSTNQFLERRILITKELAEQQSVDLGDNQEEAASLQSNSSSHEMDRDLIRLQDRTFKDKGQGDLSAKPESPGSLLGGVDEIQDVFLSDMHQEGDEVMSGRIPDEETLSGKGQEEDLILSERVKAAASNDEQSAVTNKQLAPAKICLRKSGSIQVYLNHLKHNRCTYLHSFPYKLVSHINFSERSVGDQGTGRQIR